MTEPTDEPSGEWLDNNIYGPIILAPHAEEQSHLDGLVAVYRAGVASQAARIEELEAENARLERELASAFDRGRASGRADVAKYSHAIGRIESALGYTGARRLSETVAAVEALKSERDTLTRDKSTLESRLKDVRDILCDFDEPHRSGDKVGIRQVASKAATEVLRLRTDKVAMLAKVEAQRVELSEALAAVAELDSTVDTRTRELAEAKAYGEGRNDECNSLQRALNMAAEERDRARRELAEAREELVRLVMACSKLLASKRSPVENADNGMRVTWRVDDEPCDEVQSLLDAHRSAKARHEETFFCSRSGWRGDWSESAKGICPPCAAGTLYAERDRLQSQLTWQAECTKAALESQERLAKELADAREALNLLIGCYDFSDVLTRCADQPEAKAPEFLEVEHPANAMAAKALEAEGVQVNRHPKEFAAAVLPGGQPKCKRCGGDGMVLSEIARNGEASCGACRGTGVMNPDDKWSTGELPDKGWLQRGLDSIRANPPRSVVTEADGPLFIPEPVDDDSRLRSDLEHAKAANAALPEAEKVMLQRAHAAEAALGYVPDDGPPRVGDVVRIDELLCESKNPTLTPSKRFAVGSRHMFLSEASDGSIELETNGVRGSWFVFCRFSIVLRAHETCVSCRGFGGSDTGYCRDCRGTGRRAGKPEAQTGELAAKTGGLAEQTWELPGGHGPNTYRLAELERRVARLENWLITPGSGGTTVDAIRAERAENPEH